MGNNSSLVTSVVSTAVSTNAGSPPSKVKSMIPLVLTCLHPRQTRKCGGACTLRMHRQKWSKSGDLCFFWPSFHHIDRGGTGGWCWCWRGWWSGRCGWSWRGWWAGPEGLQTLKKKTQTQLKIKDLDVVPTQHSPNTFWSQASMMMNCLSLEWQRLHIKHLAYTSSLKTINYRPSKNLQTK